MQTETKDHYLPVHVVSLRLSCSKDTIYDLLARRELRGIRLGVARGLRVSEKSLAEFLKKAEAEFDADF